MNNEQRTRCRTSQADWCGGLELGRAIQSLARRGGPGFFVLFYLYLWLYVDLRLIYYSAGMITEFPAFFRGWEFLLYNTKGMYKQGMEHYHSAMRIDPNDPRIHYDLGMALLHQRKFDQSVRHLTEALRRTPQGIDKQYNLVDMNRNLGQAMLYNGDTKGAALYLSAAVNLDPNNAAAHYTLATALAAQREIDQALAHYSKAVSLKPQIDTSATLHDLLAMNYAVARRFHEAVASAEKALELAQIAGDEPAAQEIKERLELYRQISKTYPESSTE